MAKLAPTLPLQALRFFLALAVLIVLSLLFFHLQEIVETAASKNCPPETFMSGPTHRTLLLWVVSVAVIGPFFLILQGMSLLFPSLDSDRKLALVPSRRSLTIVIGATIAAFCAWFVIGTPQFCLSQKQILRRDLPWQTFRASQWREVTQINVDCRTRGKSPDLYYVLTLKDGGTLDLADARDLRKEFSELRHELARNSFDFDAKIAPSCPEWYRDWVGVRP